MKASLVLVLIFVLFAFSEKEMKQKNLVKSLAFVPSGKVVLGKDTSTVQAFYISKTEVSNQEYRIFLADLKAKNRMEDYKIALPDTSKWFQLMKTQAYQDYYFSHPAYDSYPVVNVSYEGAMLYCKWFTERINAKSKIHYEQFRLPTQAEFVRACRGDQHGAQYAWGHNAMSNEKNQVLCNFITEPSSGSYAGSVSEKSDILAPVKSYWPNTFGLYNLNGNAAEMLSEKGKSAGGSWKNKAAFVKNESIDTYENASPMVGFRMVSTYLIKK